MGVRQGENVSPLFFSYVNDLDKYLMDNGNSILDLRI